MAKRILIVEDDDDIASIERDYLEVGGYEVTVEENGTAGLAEALTGSFWTSCCPVWTASRL